MNFISTIIGEHGTAFLGAFADQFVTVFKVISAFTAMLSGLGLLYIVVKSSSIAPQSEIAKKSGKSIKAIFQKEWTQIREQLKKASDSDAALINI